MKELSLYILDIAQNSITAGAALINISLVDDGDGVTVTVADNGKGMSAELLRNVTDPFVTTRTTRRIGMGIPLFKMAAEQTGGWLRIDSTPGAGATLTARFVHCVDAPPVGDMASTIAALVNTCSTGNIDLAYTRKTPYGRYSLDTRQMRETLADVPLDEPEVQSWIRSFIEENDREVNCL
jgi:hypothetical protein